MIKGDIYLFYENYDMKKYKIGRSMKGLIINGERPSMYCIKLDSSEKQILFPADLEKFNNWIFNNVLPCIKQ